MLFIGDLNTNTIELKWTVHSSDLSFSAERKTLINIYSQLSITADVDLAGYISALCHADWSLVARAAAYALLQQAQQPIHMFAAIQRAVVGVPRKYRERPYLLSSRHAWKMHSRPSMEIRHENKRKIRIRSNLSSCIWKSNHIHCFQEDWSRTASSCRVKLQQILNRDSDHLSQPSRFNFD